MPQSRPLLETAVFRPSSCWLFVVLLLSFLRCYRTFSIFFSLKFRFPGIVLSEMSTSGEEEEGRMSGHWTRDPA